jgi:hypothetical protein
VGLEVDDMASRDLETDMIDVVVSAAVLLLGGCGGTVSKCRSPRSLGFVNGPLLP